ncbi:MAG: hypothetical protein WC868_05720 [Bacteroidales bacterium]
MNIFFSRFIELLPILAIFGAFFSLIILFYLRLRQEERGVRSEDKFDQLYLKIKEDIKFAVAPKSLQISLELNHMIELAAEIWRIEQSIIKSSSSLPENQRKKLELSIQKLKRYIEKYDIEFIDHTNQKYNDGLNLDVLSVEKDSSIQEPIVKETIEPTIMHRGQVVRKAKIILLNKL